MLIKLEWLGYHAVKKNYDNMLSRFHIRRNTRTSQTDWRTDKIAISMSRENGRRSSDLKKAWWQISIQTSVTSTISSAGCKPAAELKICIEYRHHYWLKGGNFHCRQRVYLRHIKKTIFLPETDATQVVCPCKITVALNHCISSTCQLQIFKCNQLFKHRKTLQLYQTTHIHLAQWRKI